jgi:hypothetical protein
MTVFHTEYELSRDAVTYCQCAGGGVPWQSPQIYMRVGHPGMGACVVGMISRIQSRPPRRWMLENAERAYVQRLMIFFVVVCM